MVTTEATQSTAVAVVEKPRATLMRPIAAPKDVLVAQEETRALIKEALKPDRDYGLIKGTQRETLFKAGAERIILAFGCFAQFRVVEKEIDHDRVNAYAKKGKEETSLGLYRYVVECQIVNRANGEIVGSFIGSCSSMESKYISRPRDSENTIVKMAEKRALVGAALTTYGLSDQFTQDLEEGGTAPAEEKAPVKTVFTLDEAAAFPFPFKRGTAMHGKPLGDLPTGALVSIQGWIREKQQEDETFHQDTLAAINVVLDARPHKLVKQEAAASEIATDADLEEDRRPAHAGAVAA